MWPGVFSMSLSLSPRILIQSAFAVSLLLLPGCGHWEEVDKAVSAATRRGLGDYSGTLDTANLVPVSYANEPGSAETLGRTFKFAGPRLVTLNTSSACRDSLPGKPVATSEGTISKFSYSFLQMMDQNTQGQTQLKLDYLGYAGNIKTDIKQKSLLAAKVSLAQILAFPGSPNWSEFENCCKLTGTCGDYVVSEMYQMSQSVKALAFNESNLQSAINASGNDALKALTNISGTVDYVHKSTQSTDLGVDKTFWSHFGFRQLPPVAEAPLEGVFLSLEPNKVDCSTSGNKSIGLRLNLNNAAGSEAERMLGYNLAIPAGWENVSLKNEALADRVLIKNGELSCRPSKGKTCPPSLEINITPPECNSVQDLTRSDWKANLALYIPGSASTTGYRAHQESTSTLVVPSKLKNIPEARLSQSLLRVDLTAGGEKSVNTVMTIDTGDLTAPQFRVIAPSVNFAQVLVYPPNQKKVEIEVAVSPAICADFNLSPVLHVPMQVIVWGKRPGAVDTTLFEVPPVNITVKPQCPPKVKLNPTPTQPVNADPPPAAVN
jgi:hypothetical protein